MNRFRFTYGSHDFGQQCHVCIGGPDSICVRFVHPSKHGKRQSYMRAVQRAKKTLRKWVRDKRHVRFRARIRRRIRE